MTKQGPINHKAVISHCYADKSYKAALELAKKLYKKEKRKHTNIEFLSHPLTVGSLLLDAGYTGAPMVTSALQDVLTRTTLQESTLRAQFGDAVANQVIALTPVKGADGKLDIEAYKAQLVSAGPDVQTIKLASILDDVCAIPSNKLAGEAEFLKEAKDIAGVLTFGNAELARRVQVALRNARA